MKQIKKSVFFILILILLSFVCEVEFVFSNDPKTILDYTNNVLACDIHTRAKTKKLLSKKGVTVYDLTDIVTEPAFGSTNFTGLFAQ